MNIMDILYSSSVDGDGFRDVIFVAGCPHHCKGCHNPQSWDPSNGHYESCENIFKNLMESSITNVTFSGGEPFNQSIELIKLAKMIHSNSNKDIWIYSGYTYEEIIRDPNKLELLKLCKVLVDGHFVEKLKVPNLRFKGSSNQRIIDIQKSLKDNKIVLYYTGMEEYI